MAALLNIDHREALFNLKEFPVSLLRGCRYGIPKGTAFPLVKGGVNTPTAKSACGATERRRRKFIALEAKGWFWRDEFIVAPNETIWLLGADPWQGDLIDFHERMINRKQKIIRNVDAHEDKSQHQNVVDDIASLVASLESLNQK